MNSVRRLLLAAKESGRSVFELLPEILRLRMSVGRIGLSEYFDFQLYLNDLSPLEKTRFGGWRLQSVLEEILVDDYSRFLSLDKVTMYAVLRGLGLPTPEPRAAFRCLRPKSIPQLDSADALARFLMAPNALPVYIKPAFGSYGRGNTLIREYADGILKLGDGSSMEIAKFCASLDDGRGLGWLLQEPLTAHPRIAEICGDKISGLRLHTFLTPSGPVVAKAIWKINVGTRDSDNFHHGTSGNLLAAVRLEDGVIERVVAGVGAEQRLNPPHPRSGKQLVGFQLPHWEAIKSLVCDGQLAFPGFICPGWDIAICTDGPKILEVNSFGDIDLYQQAHRRGFIDDEFLDLLHSRQFEPLLFSNAGRWRRSNPNNRLGLRRRHWRW